MRVHQLVVDAPQGPAIYFIHNLYKSTTNGRMEQKQLYIYTSVCVCVCSSARERIKFEGRSPKTVLKLQEAYLTSGNLHAVKRRQTPRGISFTAGSCKEPNRRCQKLKRQLLQRATLRSGGPSFGNCFQVGSRSRKFTNASPDLSSATDASERARERYILEAISK